MQVKAEEAYEKGALQKAVEAAKSFYANGASIELIAKSLKLTEDQVRDIVKEKLPLKVE
jgi:DNA-binding transcriptional regulator LsrR (DeoR family)